MAGPPEPTFAFVGQPECVELSYADGLTRLTNSLLPVKASFPFAQRLRLLRAEHSQAGSVATRSQ